MPLVVAVTWHAKPGTEERIEAVFAEMVALTMAEPGCLLYQPHRATDGPNVYFIYEQFIDEAAFNTHLQSRYYQRLITNGAAHLLEHRERSLYTTIEIR